MGSTAAPSPGGARAFASVPMVAWAERASSHPPATAQQHQMHASGELRPRAERRLFRHNPIPTDRAARLRPDQAVSTLPAAPKPAGRKGKRRRGQLWNSGISAPSRHLCGPPIARVAALSSQSVYAPYQAFSPELQ